MIFRRSVNLTRCTIQELPCREARYVARLGIMPTFLLFLERHFAHFKQRNDNPFQNLKRNQQYIGRHDAHSHNVLYYSLTYRSTACRMTGDGAPPGRGKLKCGSVDTFSGK